MLFKKVNNGQNSFLAIVLADKFGKVVNLESNKDLTIQYQLTQDLEISEVINTWLHTPDASIASEKFKEVINGVVPTPCQIRVRKKNENKSPCYLIYSIVEINTHKYIQLIFIDLQKYKEQLREYRFYNDIVTHELNNILGNLNLALNLSDNMLKNPIKREKLLEMHDIMNSQVSRGARIISYVRKLSTLRKREFSLVDTDAWKILQKSVQYIKKTYHNRDINISINCPYEKIIIKANRLLADVFENILINAIKHNERPEKRIQIEFSQIQLNGEKHIKISFIDNGVGIPESKKKLLFKPIMEGDLSTKGMGLGLALVAKIMKKFRGKIKVEDKKKGVHSQGSKFILFFPVEHLTSKMKN